jgi:hypothetical protein
MRDWCLHQIENLIGNMYSAESFRNTFLDVVFFNSKFKDLKFFVE